jgi:hypothetical protein
MSGLAAFVVSGCGIKSRSSTASIPSTPYTSFNSPLPLDDATQRAIQNKQATLSAYLPLASQFDLRERRNIGTFSVLATPTPQLDLKAGFTTTRHEGELPWGASFGFSNDVEVALPYDSRTNDFNLGTEWTNGKQMLRVGYTGSWFNNLDDTLVWDSPLRLDDDVTAGRAEGAWRCGHRIRRKRSALPVTRSSRIVRNSRALSRTDPGATTSRCNRSRSTRRFRRSHFRGRAPRPRRVSFRRTSGSSRVR